MADSGIGLENDPQQQAGAAAAGTADKGDMVTLTRAEVDALRRDRDEARQSERFWAEKAQANHGNGNGNGTQAAAPPDDGPDPSEFLDPNMEQQEVEGDTPEKLIDEFAASGVAALSKRGFITAKDAHKIAVEAALHVSQEMIGRERQKMGTDSQLMAEFPELRDQNSDLFKATATRFQRAVAMDPNARKSPAALFLAAEAARESLRSTARPGRDRDERDEPYYDRGREPEQDRRARAAAQDARSSGKQQIDDMDMLGPEAKEVARLMGVTEKEFQDSRKQLGGRPRSRR